MHGPRRFVSAMTFQQDLRNDAYIHGTVPEEQKRLSLLNDLLNEACLREMLCWAEGVRPEN